MSLADELEQLINGLRQALRKPSSPELTDISTT
jgi:hypothetical protein